MGRRASITSLRFIGRNRYAAWRRYESERVRAKSIGGRKFSRNVSRSRLGRFFAGKGKRFDNRSTSRLLEAGIGSGVSSSSSEYSSALFTLDQSTVTREKDKPQTIINVSLPAELPKYCTSPELPRVRVPNASKRSRGFSVFAFSSRSVAGFDVR